MASADCVAKGLEEVHHLDGKRAGRLAVDDEAAQDVLLAEQGNGQQRAVARGGNEIAHGARVRAHGDVGDLHGLAARRRPTEDTLGLGDGLLTDGVQEGRGEIIARSEQAKLLRSLVVAVDGTAVGARQLIGASGDRGEHGLQMQGRAERMADLAEGRQLGEGL